MKPTIAFQQEELRTEVKRLALRLIGATQTHRITGSVAEARMIMKFLKETLDEIERLDEKPVWSDRLYLDDERPTPEGWLRAYTANEAIAHISTGKLKEVSLDHDLGDLDGDCGDGYEVACYIEEAAWLGKIPRLRWTVHSMNPTGAEKMRMALYSANKAWDDYEAGR